jgi:hypothetical protein
LLILYSNSNTNAAGDTDTNCYTLPILYSDPNRDTSTQLDSDSGRTIAERFDPTFGPAR